MSESMSKDMSEKLSEDMSERVSNDLSERMAKDMSERCQKECQKICQKECQKIYQKICQKERQKIASRQSAKLRVTEHISGDELYVYPHLTRSGWHKSDGCGSLSEYFKKGTSWPKHISLVSLSQGNLKSMFQILHSSHHILNDNPHLTTSTQHVMVGITRSKIIFSRVTVLGQDPIHSIQDVNLPWN